MANSKKRGSKLSFLLTMTAGAALAYFMDLNQGTRRRHIAQDKLGKWLRLLGSRSGKVVELVGNKAYGTVMETVPHQRDNPNPDDKTLKDRVESEIFRDTRTSRENININVVNGIVEIRGEQPTQQDIDDLVNRVRSIPDVRGVHNYLHLPNTPAPNKESAIEAS